MPASAQAPPLTSGATKSQRRGMKAGEEIYLWALVLIEVLTLILMRQMFRRHHGG